MSHHSTRQTNDREGIGAIRRGLLLLLGSLLVVISSPLDAAVTPRLYVFANADMRAQSLEKELEAELPGVDVTVFSRIRELETGIGDRPDAVLALRPVLEALGLHPDLQGQSNGRPTEKYVLISRQAAVAPGQLQGKDLGVVNILGRKKMDDFVRGLLGGSTPKLKHVTHERDLLALLQFDAVTAVLTSETWARKFREKSEMDLKTTSLPTEVGLAAVAFGSAQGRSALEARIRGASNAFNSKLGVTQWR